MTPDQLATPAASNAADDIQMEDAADEAPPDHSNWQGFCDIESEPAVLNVMLKEWGVRGVRIREIYSLDELATDTLPKPVYGLVYCFRYFDDIDEEKQERECPDHIWYANQLGDNSCATVTLLNILNNIPGIELGDNLTSFKEHTKRFSPYDRGDALTYFDFVKRIHNTFAPRQDILNADLVMKNKRQAAQRAPKRKANAKAKSSKRTPAKKKRKVEDDDTETFDTDAPYHYQAFMPISNELWKLDGLEWAPQKLASIDDGEEWTTAVLPLLQEQILLLSETYGAEVNLMCLYHDPVYADQQALASNEKALHLLGERLAAADPKGLHLPANGSNGYSNTSNHGPPGSEVPTQMFLEAEMPKDFESRLENATTPEKMYELKKELRATQESLRIALIEGNRDEAEDAKKADCIRADLELFAREWLYELTATGRLSEIMEDITA